jgi:lipoic acid synthetase
MEIKVETVKLRHPEKAKNPVNMPPPKPDWLRVKAPVSAGYVETKI